MAIELYTGGMRSGKTQMLMKIARAAQAAGNSVVIIKNGRDVREGLGDKSCIKSRANNVQLPSSSAGCLEDIKKIVAEHSPNILVVDELHFFDVKTAKYLIELALGHLDIQVFVAGLDYTFELEPFPSVKVLIDHGSVVVHRPEYARCDTNLCQNVARFSHRITNEEGVIVVGDTNYQSLCPDCMMRENPSMAKKIEHACQDLGLVQSIAS